MAPSDIFIRTLFLETAAILCLEDWRSYWQYRIDTSEEVDIRPAFHPYCKEMTATITRTEQVNHDTKKITLAIPPDPISKSKHQVLGVPAGATIEVFPLDGSDKRCGKGKYAPISDVNTLDELQLLVKKHSFGKRCFQLSKHEESVLDGKVRVSTALHSLDPGAQVSLRATWSTWTNLHYDYWQPSDTPRDLLFLAGGNGIAPLYSLTKRILGFPRDQSRIQLLWGVKGTRDISLARELEQLQQDHPGRLQVTYLISEKEDLPQPLGECVRFKNGRIDKAAVQEALERCRSGILGDERGVMIWLCGPTSMEDALAGTEGAIREASTYEGEDTVKWGWPRKDGVLAELGFTRRQVHKFDGERRGRPPLELSNYGYLCRAIERIRSSE